MFEKKSKAKNKERYVETNADSAELNTVLTENIDDAVIVLSKDFTVEFVSANAERILGVPAREIGKDISNLGKGKYVADDVVTYDTLKSIQAGTSVTYMVGRVHAVTKETRYYSEKVTATEVSGERKYAVVISDRTAELLTKQSLEEALKIAQIANQSKSAFLANMSREIRTPLNSIIGLCTLLQKDGEDPEKMQDHVRQLVLTGRHTLTLINDVLDMSKIEAGESVANVSEIVVMDLINEIKGAISPQAKAKNQSFKITVAVKTEKILGDRFRIKKVLLNVLSNAVKYTPEGGHIDFIVQQVQGSARKFVYFQFIVKDDGVGMSEEFVQKIFQPYSRDITAKQNGGMGLGLAVAKSLIDGMGGTIAVESKEGEGSTFAVNLKFPVSKVNEADFWKAHNIQRVLIVGDNNVDNSAIVWAMRKSEVAISSAKNLKLASAAIDRTLTGGKCFNLVILDWLNGSEEGVETLRALRKELPDYVPIVVLGSTDEDVQAAKDACADAVIKKPFSVEAFQECISSLRMDLREALMPTGEKSVLADKRFLVAEDNDLNALVLSELLSAYGATCVVKPNGKEVVDEFLRSAEGEYDGILMDVMMPLMDGYDATKLIRASNHVSAQNIPIIAMTANAFADDVKKSLGVGMNAYMLKPIDMIKLEETYQSVIRK